MSKHVPGNMAFDFPGHVTVFFRLRLAKGLSGRGVGRNEEGRPGRSWPFLKIKMTVDGCIYNTRLCSRWRPREKGLARSVLSCHYDLIYQKMIPQHRRNQFPTPSPAKN